MWPLSIFNSCLDNRVFNVKYLYIDDPFKLIHSCPIKLFSSLFPSSCFPFPPQRKMDRVGIGHFLPLRPEEGKTWSIWAAGLIVAGFGNQNGESFKTAVTLLSTCEYLFMCIMLPEEVFHEWNLESGWMRKTIELVEEWKTGSWLLTVQ